MATHFPFFMFGSILMIPCITWNKGDSSACLHIVVALNSARLDGYGEWGVFVFFFYFLGHGGKRPGIRGLRTFGCCLHCDATRHLVLISICRTYSTYPSGLDVAGTEEKGVELGIEVKM